MPNKVVNEDFGKLSPFLKKPQKGRQLTKTYCNGFSFSGK